MFHEHSKEGGEGLRTLAAPLAVSISCPVKKGAEQPNSLDSSVLVGCGAATVEAKLSPGRHRGGTTTQQGAATSRAARAARRWPRGDRRDSGVAVTAEACGSSCPSL